ncbi:DUF5895 domain-containing protein [Pleurocapsa sp. FMAR1]|uniref:DUF5895 domain-containing protein n=1 Tax=Pleurocapsa sp. FMAR1 TaxID=3040204 RepID=UPI0029C86BCF|nr:DUF5895 domain-containing protein [Pleurocapsa sp. FMAR1]
MSNYQDFGFASNEYNGELTTPPYCQFLNAGSKNYGIAITPANVQLAEFELIDTWQPLEHEFSDGTTETLLVTQQPRLLILNRSMPLMSNEFETIAYSKAKFHSGNYKAFSYLVVWFLDNFNKPLSKLPFRLKCSGYSGYTFLKNYSYYNNPDSFCQKFLTTYKTLSCDRAINKNDVFYAHGVYQPTLIRQKATSSVNGQSSFAVMTDSFIEPTKDNFASLIIKNGSNASNQIKEFTQTTKPWLKTETVEHEHDENEVSQSTEPKGQNGIKAGLTPEPIAF